MDPFTEDLWGIILARLPLRSITSSKLVCKQWISIVESPVLLVLPGREHLPRLSNVPIPGVETIWYKPPLCLA
ncbi:predicted protein [Arabidopsis lyrata subsp. lyrata]|uniref:Predicted protein n=1 Tax=Arabidopsis lyrata subsp. lyrata TaxID=81972 RepID=D7L511_ARALL|nr:predicted protein [Arabidopsis lyrata subsp. lyrata]